MRRGWTLVVASLALVFAAGAPSRAGDSRTEWDETERRPPVDRPAEYRTPSTDTWIDLGPVVGGFMADGGLKLEGAPMVGVKLGLEPADVLELGLTLLGSLPIGDWGARRLGTSSGIDKTTDIDGEILQFGATLALRNPEIAFGPVQFWIGAHFDAFYLSGYSGNVSVGGAPARASFKDTTIFAAGPFPRMDINFGDRFRLELSLPVLFPLYARGSPVGNMPEKKFNFEHIIFEPTLALVLRF